MTHTIRNDLVSYSMDDRGLVVSVFNRRTGREYCAAPGEPFRLIYQKGSFYERSANAIDQPAPVICVSGDEMTVFYPSLRHRDGETVAVSLRFTYRLSGETLTEQAVIRNEDDAVAAELQTTPLAGLGSLSGDPEKDTLLVPTRLGYRIPDPYHTDFFRHSPEFKKKYERPDYDHSDLDCPYPGASSMQWFSLYNEKEGLYIGNHDPGHRIICMHTERRRADDTLRLGVIHYPFLEKGEEYETPPLVCKMLDGDWHEGAKTYRLWMTGSCGWKAPVRPEWAQEFQGWLRCIFRTQSGEYNFRFTDIPRMFDQVQKYGLNTLFILGWPRGGFGRLRPDYYVDEDQKADLLRGIDYVHSKGGRVILYVSYHAVDRKSEYYLKENGEAVLMRDYYGDYVRFSETYARDATYRKVLNNPRSQYCTCCGSDQWHEKMVKSADTCLSLGADGVLYDLGGTKPLFCFAPGHDHRKANESRASKARRYRDLRANIKSKGEQKAILEEHCIDIYAQHMDLVQPPVFAPRSNYMPEMFRYTFPEVLMTNRNNAMDEEGMFDNVNYSFVFDLAYDLSIFRCCGLPDDIPNYCAYMAKVVALRQKYRRYFREGRFVDEEGFSASKPVFFRKAYRAPDGALGLAVWNDSDRKDTVVFTNAATGKSVSVTLEKDEVTFVEL